MITADYVPDQSDTVSVKMTVAEANRLMVYISQRGADVLEARQLYHALNSAVKQQEKTA